VKRKNFIHTLGATTLGALAIRPIFGNAHSLGESEENPSNHASGHATTTPPKSPYILPKTGTSNAPHNEAYWGVIAKNFKRPAGFINLENGYFSHQPQGTLSYHIDAETTINTQTSHFMRTAQTQAIEEARNAFAGFQGLIPDEVAFTRNTTESLNIIIMGTQWQPGDEVIIGDQDYGSMVEAFQQTVARWMVRLKVAEVPVQPNSDAEIIRAYTSMITPRTKMLHLTHMINLTGQLIPVVAITREAKKINPNIFVVVDAAHSLAHTPMDMSELRNAGADAIGGSLHKWLCNPIGAGFLFVKKQNIREIWPLMGDISADRTDIRKFEHQGTRPIQSLQTIAKAIEFHRLLGSASKYNRLIYLKLLWIGNKQALENFGKGMGILNHPTYQANMNAVTDLMNMDSFKLLSPLLPFSRGGAIATAALSGYTPTELANTLMSKFGIFTVGIDHPVIRGVRVTPHLSNSTSDCIALNKAFTSLCVDLIPHLEPVKNK
jgi:selenocysteine lyase/cysteine desulfurase